MCVQLMGEVTVKSVRASQTSLAPAANSPAQHPVNVGQTGARNQIAGYLPNHMLLGSCSAPVNKRG